MVSTGPAARIPAEAPKYADALLAREAPELRQTEFAVGPVFCVAPRVVAGWQKLGRTREAFRLLRNERFLDDGKAVVSADDAIHNVDLVSRHDEKPRRMVANACVFVP
jgi:hypothetical protein